MRTLIIDKSEFICLFINLVSGSLFAKYPLN